MLPVQHATCVTTHKSQGSTYEKICVDPEGIFQRGMAYVDISRSKHYSTLYILHSKLTYGMFSMDMLNQSFIKDEYVRLRKIGSGHLNHEINTINVGGKIRASNIYIENFIERLKFVKKNRLSTSE